MLRRLLALLAVLSGLALAGGPARAFECDPVAMAQAAQEAPGVAAACAPQAPDLPVRIDAPIDQSGSGAWALECAPRVWMRVDRARE